MERYGMFSSKYRFQSIIGILLVILGIAAIVLAIVITPTFATNHLSSDHMITAGGIRKLYHYRFICSLIGILLLISGSVLLIVKDLETKIQKIKSFFPRPLRVASYGIFSTLLLFFGFFTNSWMVARESWFLKQNYDMESFVVGRIVQSHQDGIFSYGGLLGNGRPDATPAMSKSEAYAYQYLAYTNDLPFGSFTTYQSQIGGQGILFSVLDGLMRLLPQQKLQIFHAFTSLLSALALSMIVLWFYLEFGLLVSLFVLASAVLSPWLVVFGGKLFWSMWSFYLPMVVIMYYFKKRNPARHNNIIFGILVFIAVLVKCLFTGYEYITTTLIMMMVPYVFYYILRKFSIRYFISVSLMAIFSSCLAILLSFIILCIQIGSVEGSFLKGIDHIEYVLEKRTYGDPINFPSVYANSLKSHTTDVVKTYLLGSYFGPEKYLPTSVPIIPSMLTMVRYLYLIFLFAMASVLLYVFRKRNSDKLKVKCNLALILATWFSLLAPLSWFVIFKAHSAIHRHMNYIVWQMPFTLFGFALCGLLVKTALTVRRPSSLNLQKKCVPGMKHYHQGKANHLHYPPDGRIEYQLPIKR